LEGDEFLEYLHFVWCVLGNHWLTPRCAQQLTELLTAMTAALATAESWQQSPLAQAFVFTDDGTRVLVHAAYQFWERLMRSACANVGGMAGVKKQRKLLFEDMYYHSQGVVRAQEMYGIAHFAVGEYNTLLLLSHAPLPGQLPTTPHLPVHRRAESHGRIRIQLPPLSAGELRGTAGLLSARGWKGHHRSRCTTTHGLPLLCGHDPGVRYAAWRTQG
jgi:hypothetical protein